VEQEYEEEGLGFREAEGATKGLREPSQRTVSTPMHRSHLTALPSIESHMNMMFLSPPAPEQPSLPPPALGLEAGPTCDARARLVAEGARTSRLPASCLADTVSAVAPLAAEPAAGAASTGARGANPAPCSAAGGGLSSCRRKYQQQGGQQGHIKDSPCP